MCKITSPRQKMAFLDRAMLFPFSCLKDNPDASCHVGFSLSNKVLQDGATLDVIQFARDFSILLVATHLADFHEMLDHCRLFSFKLCARWFFSYVYRFAQALCVPTLCVVSLIKNDHLKAGSKKVETKTVSNKRRTEMHMFISWTRIKATFLFLK